MKKLFSILTIFALIFTAMPMTGGFDASAASGLPKVKSLSATAGKTYVNLTWKALTKKNKKKITGIKIYRVSSGESLDVVATLGKTAKSYKDERLSSGTKYTYYIKTYKKTKKYLNKKTGKWQKKKPKKKYRGESKTIYSYSGAATISKSTTKIAPAASEDQLFKASSMSNVTLNSGETYTFKLQSSGTIKWKSGNTEIALIDQNGKVTANNPYSTEFKSKITATNWDGQTKTAVVTVSPSGGAAPSTPETPTYTVTDYTGKTHTLMNPNDPRYNKTVDGTWTDSNFTYTQKNGVTVEINKNSTFTFGGNKNSNIKSIEVYVYNGDINKLKLEIAEPTQVFKHGKRLTATGPISYYDLNCVVVNNNDVIERLVSFTESTDAYSCWQSKAINFFAGGWNAEDIYGFDGYLDGTVHLNVYYDWNGDGSWAASEKVDTKTVNILKCPRTAKALEIAQAAVDDAARYPEKYSEIYAYGLSEYVTDINIIQKYMLDHYNYYNDSIDGSGLNARCNGGAEVLRVWSVYKYHVFGFVGCAPGDGDHVEFYPGKDGVEKGYAISEDDSYPANGYIDH